MHGFVRSQVSTIFWEPVEALLLRYAVSVSGCAALAGPCSAGAASSYFYHHTLPAQPLTFNDRAQASLASNLSLLSARSLTSISDYLPGQAAPCRTMSARVETVPCESRLCRRVGLTLAHPCKPGPSHMSDLGQASLAQSCTA